MANLRPVPPPRGDEAQLFREFNDELMFGTSILDWYAGL